MTVINSYRDSATLTLVAEFNASVARVWRVWEDPRQLERWWGPPTWPATFERHDFVVGGGSRYSMTGPNGEKTRGWWTITTIEAPYRLEFDDGFAGEDGEPLPDMEPFHAVVTVEALGVRSRMTTVTRFADADQLEQALTMGMEEGFRLALGQIDALLAEAAG